MHNGIQEKKQTDYIVPCNIFRADLCIKSKKDILEFYNGIKTVTLIPFDSTSYIRVEPGNLISIIKKTDIKKNVAPFIPSMKDNDGKIAYLYRKYINLYLKN